ncbi:MAG: phage tail protein [Chloroflexi bacterium SZAS-1]|jgi:microcystin-dependent protein|nr:phage tail protein [Chloroflexi bacterium SZAS-1]HNP85587.1 tail fiber protein [Kouleothrix sp.]
MGDPFIGEIRATSWGFAARGWALCNGQTMAINQNQALFSLLGTMYGGNGTTTFNLPDLRGRVPIHRGPQHAQGVVAGEETHTLLYNEMPMHSHSVSGTANTANNGVPQDTFWANGSKLLPFSSTADTQMWPGTITTTGNSQPHENMGPFLTISFMIALVGIFPSRS